MEESAVKETDPPGKPTEEEKDPSKFQRLIKWLFPGGYTVELKEMIILCIGFTFVEFCQSAIQPIAVIFAGHLGKIEMATVALSNSLINITGQWVVIGTTTACDTLFSQTFGSANKKLMGAQLQRALVIHALIIIPTVTIHLNIEWILRGMGQDHEVAYYTARYLLLFLPGLVCMYLYEIVRRFIQSQGIVLPHVVIGFFGLCAHILFQVVFVWQLGWGLDGSAIAQVLGYIVMILLTVAYILVSKVYEETWDGWTLELFDDWKEFSILAFFGMLMVCLEWWAFEATIIVAGIIGPTELAAQSVIFNVDQILHLTPSQISAAITIRVGVYLGAGEPAKAKGAADVGATIGAISCVVMAILCVVLRYQIPLIFTFEPDVIQMTAETLPVVTIFYLADSIGVYAKGICRGGARQGVATIVNFIGFCVFAVPLGIVLLFRTNLGIKGLWVGLGCGLWLQDLLLILYIKYRMDWNDLAEEAKERSKTNLNKVNGFALSSLRVHEIADQSVSEITPIVERQEPWEDLFGNTMLKKTKVTKIFEKLLIIACFIMILITGIMLRLSVPVPDDAPKLCPLGHIYGNNHSLSVAGCYNEGQKQQGYLYQHYPNASLSESVLCNTRPRNLIV